MKKVLIISPYFPPSNAADMQRIRMSLPYFQKCGWEAEVVTVDPVHSDMVKDLLLMEGIPKGVKIHKVSAYAKKWTSKLGLGSIALRSLWFYKKYVDKLLKTQHFDLIYFSTTQFPVLILGAHWKKKFKIPYVIDMQDPWHSTYFEDKPKSERPSKYWFSYRLNKYLEPRAMKYVDGLISVSQAYIDTLIDRYPHLKRIPSEVITFGAFKPDFEMVQHSTHSFKLPYAKENKLTHIVYVGRGGHDMKDAILLLFTAFKKGLKNNPAQYQNIRFHFIGTSYAAHGQGTATILPLAQEMDIAAYVQEQTDRISFYESIYTLVTADSLLIIGSDDPQYTASKIYPYILAERPLLAFFHPESSAAKIINDTDAGHFISLTDQTENAIAKINAYLINLVNHTLVKRPTNWIAFEPYTAANMTRNQVSLFNTVLEKKNR